MAFFVFRPYMSCEEQDATYGGVLYWASSLPDHKGLQNLIEWK